MIMQFYNVSIIRISRKTFDNVACGLSQNTRNYILNLKLYIGTGLFLKHNLIGSENTHDYNQFYLRDCWCFQITLYNQRYLT